MSSVLSNGRFHSQYHKATPESTHDLTGSRPSEDRDWPTGLGILQ